MLLKKNRREGNEGPEDLEEPDTSWDLYKPEISWRVWNMEESLGWALPPDVILRQPDWLMEDLATISWRNGKVKEMLEAYKTLPPGTPKRAAG